MYVQSSRGIRVVRRASATFSVSVKRVGGCVRAILGRTDGVYVAYLPSRVWGRDEPSAKRIH
jgi:hypothetical protein